MFTGITTEGWRVAPKFLAMSIGIQLRNSICGRKVSIIGISETLNFSELKVNYRCVKAYDAFFFKKTAPYSK